MIDYQVIQKLSTKYQTTETNVIREYCQHLFLSYFYKNKPEIYFKGGTALRIVFNSSRFSEDLDFSSALKPAEVEKHILKTANDLENEGFKIDLTEAKPTVGGYLSELNIDAFNHAIAISLQISLRKTNSIPNDIFVITNDYFNDYSISTLAEQVIVGEKIKASIDRSKPRDFYDVYFMLRAGMINVKQRASLQLVKSKLEESSINFEVELKEFLPVNLYPIIKDFKRNLLKEIDRQSNF